MARGAGLSLKRAALYWPRRNSSGGMAEWLKALAWKACIRETVSWVRIPLPPPPTQDSPVLCGRRSAILGLSCQRFGEDLCTSPPRGRLLRFSDRPVFSEALYFADLVQSLPS